VTESLQLTDQSLRVRFARSSPVEVILAELLVGHLALQHVVADHQDRVPRRYEAVSAEIAKLDANLDRLVAQAAPELVSLPGSGTDRRIEQEEKGRGMLYLSPSTDRWFS
jgi:hypothetical protein